MEPAPQPARQPPGPSPDVLCIGAVHWDVIARAEAPMQRGDDRPGRVCRSPGGVALNVATALAGLGFRPALLSAVGDDPDGDALLAACAARGLVTRHILRRPGLTGRYVALEDPGGLVAAIADAATLEAAGPALLAALDATPGGWTGPVVIDGNLPAEVIAALASSPALARADLRAVAASNAKAPRLAPLTALPRATLYLNLAEARALSPHTDLADAPAAARALAGPARVLVTDGPHTAALGTGTETLTATPPQVTPRRATGAGDCLMAHHIAAEARGLAPEAALATALAAAARHVAAPPPAPPPAAPEPHP